MLPSQAERMAQGQAVRRQVEPTMPPQQQENVERGRLGEPALPTVLRHHH